eukprot:TRINITY_DN67919_c16_g2_i2.p1 TRINITY_DN67919_c16_g2~~TRINITY_DN67919_c16_g2_i2.p1  ORF type:complete len:380 (+),score=180.30 TRINITY_DN67919_c16_g2_i2:866-2005(+)
MAVLNSRQQQEQQQASARDDAVSGVDAVDVDLEDGLARKAQAAKAAAAAAKAKSQVVRFLCVDISHLPRIWQLVSLSLGVFGFFIACGLVEEYAFKERKLDFGWYLTFFELCCFSLFASVERKFVYREPVFQHNASLRRHFVVAMAMTLSRGLTNVSMEYLNYPTQVVFKSLKLLTVMLGSVFIVKKQYMTVEYISAAFLVVSAIFFSLGDSAVTFGFNTIGIVVVLLSLVADAVHSNTQEMVLKTHNASTVETMVFTNMFAGLAALVVVISLGELGPALKFCAENEGMYTVFIFRAFFVYGGVLCFIHLIKAFGVVMATTVTTVRKILTIILSFIIFPKSFNVNYLVGGLLFAFGVYLNVYAVRQKRTFAQPKRNHHK